VSDNEHALRESIAALSGFFVGNGTLGDTLTQVSELACRSVGPADLAGITMLVEGQPRTAVFTDAEAPEIDTAQYETGVGPCLDAFRHQRVYRIESTAEDRNWPTFSAMAAAHGVVSTMSLPLVAQNEGVGALNLYSRSAVFSDDDEDLGGLFAAQAAIVLANAQAYWDARHLSEQLGEAMQYRAVIEQAKGVLMAAGGRNADEAFQLLVRVSQRENRKLRDIATELVERAQQRPPPTRESAPVAD
jgi:GAF domain-containing protein